MEALVDHRKYLFDVVARQAARRPLADPGHAYTPLPVLSHARSAAATDYASPEAGPSKTAKGKAAAAPSKDNVVNYVAAEEALRNDYAAWYGVSGQFPSNFVLGAGDDEICEEFPALRRLMDLKAEQVATVSHPPMYVQLDSPAPSAVSSALAPHRFDVILIHPLRSWAATAQLPIRQLGADPGFVFLWVGPGDAGGLERGRECLAKWGFRRAEDIVWVKTNKKGATANGGGLFASQKEHCLMGIRGTVRRSTDSRFVHCNVDTDVIVWEGGEGEPRTPPYLYTLIENFCLGARRLELFNDAPTARRGWVSASVGPIPDGAEPFDGAMYPNLLPSKEEGKPVVPFHAEIDILRPKSPQRRGRPSAGGGRQHGPGGHGPHGHHGHSHRHGTASPPPSHTPPFRPQGGVMRLGALTPAQGYAPQMNPQFQHAHAQAMAMNMNMGNMGGMNPGMNMGGMMPMNMNMNARGMPMYNMQAMQGMQGMMSPMQLQGMAMGMNPGMIQMGGMMPMNMGMQGMQLGGMHMGMGMNPGMNAMGMNAMAMGMGMPHMGGMIPGHPSSPPIGSPHTGATTSPQIQPGELSEEDWQYAAQAQVQHGHAMGQLAMGMGAMGTPYLGGHYPYNG